MQVWSCAERGGKKAKTDLVEDQTSDLRTIETGYVKKYETTVHMYYIYMLVCVLMHTYSLSQARFLRFPFGKIFCFFISSPSSPFSSFF